MGRAANPRGPCGVEGCDRQSAIKGLCSMHSKRLRRHGDVGPAHSVMAQRPAFVRQTCIVEGCDKEHNAKGLCHMHYSRHNRQRGVGPSGEIYQSNVGKTCIGPECEKPAHCRGYCRSHYDLLQRGEDPNRRLKVHARRGSGSINGKGYRYIHVNGRQVSEHRYVLEQILGRPPKPHEQAHHINGDRLDNRPANIECWDTSQPAGQRVSDKIAFYTQFLREHGHIVIEPVKALLHPAEEYLAFVDSYSIEDK